MRSPPVRPRNDPRQYDDLADRWWQPRGAFAMLHWIAAARARRIPPAGRADAVLVDVACGGGLLAPHVAHLGYRHVGVDLVASALDVARRHGVVSVRGDARALPLADASADVVVAGEVLEHLRDPQHALREAARVLRPGGLLVLDTIARTLLARVVAVGLGERVPGGPPPRLHDPALFVDRAGLRAAAAAAGVPLTLVGLRPSLREYAGWLLRRRTTATMTPTRSTSVLFQAYGVKTAGPATAASAGRQR